MRQVMKQKSAERTRYYRQRAERGYKREQKQYQKEYREVKQATNAGRPPSSPCIFT